jgi:cytochrome c-type biogenesis protein CcmH
MRSWWPLVGLGLVVAVVAVVLLRPQPEASDAERARAIASGLRCPDCQGLSVADSPTAAAQEIQRKVDELVAAGATESDVRAYFVDRYGEWILLSPSAPLWWLVPFVAVAAGAAVLAVWVARGRRAAAPPAAVSADERRRLHEEAEALDA